MTNQRTKLTVKDYMETPDDVRCQLIDGELILAPSPTFKHQVISGHLFMVVNQFVRRHSLGVVCYAPLDVFLTANDVYQPDILFISNERRDIRTAANIQGAPDLVVEILSPSTEHYDRGRKQEIYGRLGVREYWIVDPQAETVEVLSGIGSRMTSTATYGFEDALVSPLLPRLSIDLAEVFAED